MPVPELQSSTHSETLVFIGAGATATLGMPQTSSQTDILRKLCEGKEKPAEILKDFFEGDDLAKAVAFLEMLEGTERNNFEVSQDDLEQARIAFGRPADDGVLLPRVLELRRDYDWNALKKILKICPHNKANDNLIVNIYSIIDKKLLAHQSLKVKCGPDEEVLPVSRLQGARNFLVLFINMLFASAWNKIVTADYGKNYESFKKYTGFLESFARMMQDEGCKFHRQGKQLHDRSFYLYTTSFVSFNFEMVFPWLLMVADHEANHRRRYIGDRPLRLWLDYGCEHRGRKLEEDGSISPTLEFTESVVSRENEDGTYVGSELNRCGKFYFAHGSSNWRECPVCGRMTFYFGASRSKWTYKSRELISPFPIPLFGVEADIKLTEKEKGWHDALRFDSLECMHCGSETRALDAPMIMQTMYKSTPTSFLEEIQRDVKVALEKARHIVLLGYQLPSDDTIWCQNFAESVRSRLESDERAFCSVVVGYRGLPKWLYDSELKNYVTAHRKADDADNWGVPVIQNAWAIFGDKNVRAWTGGIPQVFGSCTEREVKELLYPSGSSFANWKGTRIDNG